MFQAILACTNLSRQLFRNMLTAVLCATMVFFLCSYAGNIRANQEQLASLPGVIPVSAYISNLNGSRNTGLLISGSMIDQIEASGLVRDMVCTIQMPATYAPEKTETKEKPKIVYLMRFNTLRSYPSIQPDSMGEVEAFLAGQSAHCIVSRHFLADEHLSIGDTVELDLYRYQHGEYPGEMTYEHLAPRVLTIVDSFDSRTVTMDLTVLPNIIFPIGWAKKVFEECGSPFYFDSASFYVKDPLRLNDLKTLMKGLRLLPLSPQASDSVSGSALVINDETFIRSATSIQNNLTLLWLFSPALIAAALLASTVLSHLMMHSRRGEFAVMRSLGMTKRACLEVYLMECGLLALPGGTAGALAALMLSGVPLPAAAVALMAFWIAYILGAYIAVRMLGRVSVVAMLSSTN